jgi:hypothetical protein
MSTNPESDADELVTEADVATSEAATPPPPLSDPSRQQQAAHTEHEPFASEPYTFEQCTITLTLQFWPEDGHPQGRLVLVSARNHRDSPLITVARATELGPLPPQAAELLERLRAEQPERERARAEREAERKPAAVKTPPPSRKAKPVSKPPAVAPQPPKPPQAVQPPQVANTHEQLDMFTTHEGGSS